MILYCKNKLGNHTRHIRCASSAIFITVSNSESYFFVVRSIVQELNEQIVASEKGFRLFQVSAHLFH
ncbi:hypothetical protein B0H12DRAFT_1138551 [Mycena haematopus]|nr:hypothetical protein B0H12DRAFT_1138551 [Mycena haematopus]